jgi:ParB family chromosome partitioning protein
VTVPGRKGGLGRGLGALIPQGPADPTAGPDVGLASVDGARFAELPIAAITPNHVQPRTVFDEEALSELTESIRQVGLLQPIVVRPSGPDCYELIMGERRWRASQRAGLTTIPAIVRDTHDDDMLRDALLENLHRSQLNPLEEAAAYQQLLADFGATHEELAVRIGRSRPQISNTIRLLGLPPAVQSRVAAGVISAGHARAILGLPTAAAMDAMAHRVVAEGLSVRSTEEAVALAAASSDAAPKRGAAQKRLVPEAAREVAERLSDRLETRVKVDVGRAKGKITIEFATLEDLQRIADIVQGPLPA